MEGELRAFSDKELVQLAYDYMAAKHGWNNGHCGKAVGYSRDLYNIINGNQRRLPADRRSRLVQVLLLADRYPALRAPEQPIPLTYDLRIALGVPQGNGHGKAQEAPVSAQEHAAARSQPLPKRPEDFLDVLDLSRKDTEKARNRLASHAQHVPPLLRSGLDMAIAKYDELIALLTLR